MNQQARESSNIENEWPNKRQRLDQSEKEKLQTQIFKTTILTDARELENEASAFESARLDVKERDQDNEEFTEIEVYLPLRYTEPLLQLEREVMASDWFETFGTELEKPYFLKIKKTLADDETKGITIYPPKHQIYTFTKCPLSQIKVVILGQDPYHGVGQAHGLCFSVQKGVPPPPSLINIYKEIEDDLGKEKFTKPNHGFLEQWCSQGVLLLNTALTVQKDKANSHASIGWEKFTDAIVSYINKNCKHVVFLLWGGNAQKKAEKVNMTKHLVLKSAHPSPLSAHRGFFKSKHFSKANDFLVKQGQRPINWDSLRSYAN